MAFILHPTTVSLSHFSDEKVGGSVARLFNRDCFGKDQLCIRSRTLESYPSRINKEAGFVLFRLSLVSLGSVFTSYGPLRFLGQYEQDNLPQRPVILSCPIKYGSYLNVIGLMYACHRSTTISAVL